MNEVIGIIEDVVFRNEDNGFTVMEIRSEAEGTTVTVVGNLPFAVEGERVKVTGQWAVHPDYGEQLKVENYETASPTSQDGLERYLLQGSLRVWDPLPPRGW